MIGDLDSALQLSISLRTELLNIPRGGLHESQLPLLADAIDMNATVTNRLDAAIEIDDNLHPEER
jgi:hypothetical protein